MHLRIKKRSLACFTMAMMVMGLQGCTHSNGHDTIEKVLTMGLSADYPPFEFKKNGEVVGFDVDVAQEVAKELGYKLIVQDMDFSALIPSLQSGRIDFVMAGMTITEERKKNVDFSDTYFISSFAIVVQKDASFTSEADLQGKKVGVQLGSTMEKFAKEKAKLYPGMEVVALGKNPMLIQELKSSRFFGVLAEEVQADAFVKANPMLKAISLEPSNEGYAVAFPLKGAPTIKYPQLRDEFNATLEKMKKNGKLNQIRAKWLGR